MHHTAKGTKRAKPLGTRRENGPRHSAHPKPSQQSGDRKAGPPSRRVNPFPPPTQHKPDSCDQSPKYEVCTMKVEPTPAHTHSMPDKASLKTKKLRSAMATSSAPPPLPPRPEEATPQQTPAQEQMPKPIHHCRADANTALLNCLLVEYCEGCRIAAYTTHVCFAHAQQS